MKIPRFARISFRSEVRARQARPERSAYYNEEKSASKLVSLLAEADLFDLPALEPGHGAYAELSRCCPDDLTWDSPLDSGRRFGGADGGGDQALLVARNGCFG